MMPEKPKEKPKPKTKIDAKWKEVKEKGKVVALKRPTTTSDGTPITYGPGYERWREIENRRRKAEGEPLLK